MPDVCQQALVDFEIPEEDDGLEIAEVLILGNSTYAWSDGSASQGIGVHGLLYSSTMLRW